MGAFGHAMSPTIRLMARRAHGPPSAGCHAIISPSTVAYQQKKGALA